QGVSQSRRYGERPVSEWAKDTFPRAVTTLTLGRSESSAAVLWEAHSYRDMHPMSEPYAITRRGSAPRFREAIEQAHADPTIRPRLGRIARLRVLLTGRVRCSRPRGRTLLPALSARA